MRIENTMARQLRQLDKFPAGWKVWLQTQIMGRFVPFLKTAGLRFERISHEEVCVSVQNRKKIQNHINGVHACAMALLAETATGFVTNMNTPDDKLILLKAMHINYTRRSVGNMRAVAQINDEQAAMIAQEERELMQRALDENSVIVAQMTPFFEGDDDDDDDDDGDGAP